MSTPRSPVVLITGGGRGIGRAIVQRFLKDGATVLACGRGPRPPELSSAAGWMTADVSRGEEVSKLVEVAWAEHGQIDVLVNNAGVQLEKSIVETTDADWDLLMGTNAKGVFHCSRAVIPYMKQTGKGAIVNIGSISGLQADAHLALYNASKAFVHGLTRSIAVDHGADGIRCNAVCPGWIETQMAGAAFAAAKDPRAAEDDAVRRHPVGRMGTAADVASMVAWLASDEATFVSGQLFVADGGLTAASPIQPRFF